MCVLSLLHGSVLCARVTSIRFCRSDIIYKMRIIVEWTRCSDAGRMVWPSYLHTIRRKGTALWSCSFTGWRHGERKRERGRGRFESRCCWLLDVGVVCTLYTSTTTHILRVTCGSVRGRWACLKLRGPFTAYALTFYIESSTKRYDGAQQLTQHFSLVFCRCESTIIGISFEEKMRRWLSPIGTALNLIQIQEPAVAII